MNETAAQKAIDVKATAKDASNDDALAKIEQQILEKKAEGYDLVATREQIQGLLIQNSQDLKELTEKRDAMKK